MRMRWQYVLVGLVASATGMAMARTLDAQLAPNMSYDGRTTLAHLKYNPVSNPEACQGADSPAAAGATTTRCRSRA